MNKQQRATLSECQQSLLADLETAFNDTDEHICAIPHTIPPNRKDTNKLLHNQLLIFRCLSETIFFQKILQEDMEALQEKG